MIYECIDKMNGWLCCNNGVEEIVYPELMIKFWTNNSMSTVRINNHV